MRCICDKIDVITRSCKRNISSSHILVKNGLWVKIVTTSLGLRYFLSHIQWTFQYWPLYNPCYRFNRCEWRCITTVGSLRTFKWRCIAIQYSASLSCFVAVKTGRYTHEKRTENIKEVKRLEQAHRAAASPEPPEGALTSCSKLPLRITENIMYEEVINRILGAYQEHPFHPVNFFANMKHTEETFMASLCL